MKISRLLLAILPLLLFLLLFLVTPTHFGWKQNQKGADDAKGITSKEDFWEVQNIHRALRPEQRTTKLFREYIAPHLPGSRSTKKGTSPEGAKEGHPRMKQKDDKASPKNWWHLAPTGPPSPSSTPAVQQGQNKSGVGFLNELAMENGTKIREAQPRIIGGEIASEGKYPFFAAVRVDVHIFPLCGGTLIAEDYVLTSAHCYYEDGMSVMMNQRQIQIEKKLIHPSYNPDKLGNDLMLLKLAERVTDVPIIGLNFDGTKPENGAEMIAMGLGQTDDSYYSNALRDVTVDAVDTADCSKKYRTVGLNINQDTMICASRIGKDACGGDSGGPLILKDTGKQVGIISWGFKCADSRYPGVYTRISAFETWITDNVPGLADSLAAPGVTSECRDQEGAFRKVSLRSGIDTCAKLLAAGNSRRTRVCRRSNAKNACKRTCGTCGT